MEHILTDIRNKIHRADEIIIRDMKYQEIIGYSYELTVNDITWLLNDVVCLPNNLLDKHERDEILNFFKTFDFSDINTRQCVMQPKYQEDETKSACISCLQIIVRGGEIQLYVHVRSQNFLTNFLYDNQTYSLIINNLSKKLNVKIFKVFVKVVSLHQLK